MINLIIKANFDGYESKSMMDYSFLNPASFGDYVNRSGDNLNYFIDGSLLANVLSFLLGKKIVRVSFDYTSIADIVFKKAEKNKERIYIIGGDSYEIENFIKKVSEKYSDLNVVGYKHGFVGKENWDDISNEIIKKKTDLVIVGMGSVLQEQFQMLLRSQGFSGVSFSCGGFIRQISGSENEIYYPKWMNELGLRWLYRMMHEPHTIKRYLINYPVNIFKLFKLYLSGKLEIKVVEE
jgi:exopolysaccharide biosynthesis WecB/TagA/CpsF family protein